MACTGRIIGQAMAGLAGLEITPLSNMYISELLFVLNRQSMILNTPHHLANMIDTKW